MNLFLIKFILIFSSFVFAEEETDLDLCPDSLITSKLNKISISFKKIKHQIKDIEKIMDQPAKQPTEVKQINSHPPIKYVLQQSTGIESSLKTLHENKNPEELAQLIFSSPESQMNFIDSLLYELRFNESLSFLVPFSNNPTKSMNPFGLEKIDQFTFRHFLLDQYLATTGKIDFTFSENERRFISLSESIEEIKRMISFFEALSRLSNKKLDEKSENNIKRHYSEMNGKLNNSFIPREAVSMINITTLNRFLRKYADQFYYTQVYELGSKNTAEVDEFENFRLRNLAFGRVALEILLKDLRIYLIAFESFNLQFRDKSNAYRKYIELVMEQNHPGLKNIPIDFEILQLLSKGTIDVFLRKYFLFYLQNLQDFKFPGISLQSLPHQNKRLQTEFPYTKNWGYSHIHQQYLFSEVAFELRKYPRHETDFILQGFAHGLMGEKNLTLAPIKSSIYEYKEFFSPKDQKWHSILLISNSSKDSEIIFSLIVDGRVIIRESYLPKENNISTFPTFSIFPDQSGFTFYYNNKLTFFSHEKAFQKTGEKKVDLRYLEYHSIPNTSFQLIVWKRGQKVVEMRTSFQDIAAIMPAKVDYDNFHPLQTKKGFILVSFPPLDSNYKALNSALDQFQKLIYHSPTSWLTVVDESRPEFMKTFIPLPSLGEHPTDIEIFIDPKEKYFLLMSRNDTSYIYYYDLEKHRLHKVKPSFSSVNSKSNKFSSNQFLGPIIYNHSNEFYSLDFSSDNNPPRDNE